MKRTLLGKGEVGDLGKRKEVEILIRGGHSPSRGLHIQVGPVGVCVGGGGDLGTEKIPTAKQSRKTEVVDVEILWGQLAYYQ